MDTIKISDLISLNQAVTPDEGSRINEMIKSYLDADKEVTLDFTDIAIMTTAFLNVAVGSLYGSYSNDKIKKLLKLKSLTQDNALRIKKVVDNAKVFYSNSKEFSKDVDEAIYGSKGI